MVTSRFRNLFELHITYMKTILNKKLCWLLSIETLKTLENEYLKCKNYMTSKGRVLSIIVEIASYLCNAAKRWNCLASSIDKMMISLPDGDCHFPDCKSSTLFNKVRSKSSKLFSKLFSRWVTFDRKNGGQRKLSSFVVSISLPSSSDNLSTAIGSFKTGSSGITSCRRWSQCCCCRCRTTRPCCCCRSTCCCLSWSLTWRWIFVSISRFGMGISLGIFTAPDSPSEICGDATRFRLLFSSTLWPLGSGKMFCVDQFHETFLAVTGNVVVVVN